MKFQVWYWISVICYHLQHADLEKEVVKRGVYRIKAKILNSVTVTNKKYLMLWEKQKRNTTVNVTIIFHLHVWKIFNLKAIESKWQLGIDWLQTLDPLRVATRVWSLWTGRVLPSHDLLMSSSATAELMALNWPGQYN